MHCFGKAAVAAAVFTAVAVMPMIIRAETDPLTVPTPVQTEPQPRIESPIDSFISTEGLSTTPAESVITDPAVTVPTPTAAPLPVAEAKVVDLVLFMGQSNMSGRGGNAKAAPKVPANTGYEFRYGVSPAGLYPVSEPFGIYSSGSLTDLPSLRGGSLVSSFMNAYYKGCGVPVMGFSAARGGTGIGFWQGAQVQQELASKYDTIRAWCAANNVHIRRSYAVWLQGETDGVGHITKTAYKTGLTNVFSRLFGKGLEQVFVITVGQYGGLPGIYDEVAAAQTELCAENPHFTLGSSALRTLPQTHLVDGCHYDQSALNTVGSQCGSVAAARSKLLQ